MNGEYKFLIPLYRDSDKQPHSEADLDWLDQTLASIFSGFTRGATVFGCWRDEGHNLVFDESTPFYIASASDSAVVDIVRQCCRRFDQQCIYLRFPSGEVSLICNI